MLVLTRQCGKEVVIAGGEIVVTVLEIRGGNVRLGFDAPKDVPVHRREVHEAIKAEGRRNDR